MLQIPDHPLRDALTNELHSRPFPVIKAPATVLFLAILADDADPNTQKQKSRAHLIDILDRFGADHPENGVTHYYGRVGDMWLKWEQHTEFVTYTAIVDGVSTHAYCKTDFDVFPHDWLAQSPGRRLTSAMIRVDFWPEPSQLVTHLSDWFVAESLAVSTVLDGAACIAGDFRYDAEQHMRFAVFTTDTIGMRRIGRIVQRLTEIETYKAMSMLGWSKVRDISAQLSEMEAILNRLASTLPDPNLSAENTLEQLLRLSAQLESLSAQTAYRFSGTAAYETIVNQRILILREQRFNGRQTFQEFMMRRFDPPMRTVQATKGRLEGLIAQAKRTGDLLRTRVDVERQIQNQKLLSSMDRRADQQLQLQRTVEGLSTVAISYYAVNLMVYALAPFAGSLGVGKTLLTAVLVPVILATVYMVVRRIRRDSH